jgi:predicted nucleic acid-binding protein
VRAFVDTNVWYYALTVSDDAVRVRANAVLDSLAQPVVNGQVLRELGRILLQKARCDEDMVRQVVSDMFHSCQVVLDSKEMFILAGRLRRNHAFSYWDSLIVAAALDTGCDTLYSEDMHHGQLVEGRLRLVNPFVGV